MKRILLYLVILIPCISHAQSLNKVFKYATFYAAVNGGTSLSDDDVYKITSGQLEQSVLKTPFDYSISVGVRKIKRFGYENRANTFYNGTENSYSDAATLGRVAGFEYLFEADFVRRLGINYLDQHHFVRYVADKWVTKVEYLQDGFADIQYFEASERYRQQLGNKLSINIGAVQRFAEPYGFDPLADWVLDNGTLHYTYLALQEGYSINMQGEYFDPNGELVAVSQEVWEEVVIPQVLDNYVADQRGTLSNKIEQSLVIGLDYYHFTKDFWFHTWGNLMPIHLKSGNEYSYHAYNNDKQWLDYSGGLIFGYKFNKSLGVFAEGKYNKYWNRSWYDFSFGLNYVIF